MMDKLLNEKEAAEYLGIPEQSLKILVEKKKLPAYRIGGQFLRFDKKDLDLIRLKPVEIPKKQHREYPLSARLRDYFYYNDFYIILAILIIILLALVFRASF